MLQVEELSVQLGMDAVACERGLREVTAQLPAGGGGWRNAFAASRCTAHAGAMHHPL